MLKLKEKDLLLVSQGKYLAEKIATADLIRCLCGKPVHYTYLTSNGSWGKHYSMTELLHYLNKLDIKYKVKNDAPRGGRLGDFVKLTGQLSKRRRIVKGLLDECNLQTKAQREFSDKLCDGASSHYVDLYHVVSEFLN